MTFSGAEIAAWVGTFMWPFFRIGAILFAAPIIGTRNVPVRIRLLYTLLITFLIVPTLEPVPVFDPFSMQTWFLIAQQMLIGFAMGMILQLAFAAIITGGQVIALQMGLGFASMVDPTSGMQVPMVSQFYLLATMLLFFAFQGHHVLIEVMVESFRTMPISPDGLTRDGFWTVATWGTQMFAGALLLAIPTVASLLVVNLSFGIMTRAAPQLNIFAIGFPFMVGVGFAVMWVTLPGILPQTSDILYDAFMSIREITSGK
jgi:flagellar biosynthetic protein FliR